MHALAVLYQLTWLLEDDPFVLLQLRGLPRDDLLARLHRAPGSRRRPGRGRSRTSTTSTPAWTRRCGPRALRLLDDPDDQSLDHLF